MGQAPGPIEVARFREPVDLREGLAFAPLHQVVPQPRPAAGRCREQHQGRRDGDTLPATRQPLLATSQRVDQLLGRRVPRAGGLLETASNQPVHVGRDLGTNAPERGRRFGEDRAEQPGDRLAAEGPSSGEHLVQDDPQGELVRETVDGTLLGLLRRHVGSRAEEHARSRLDGDRRELPAGRPRSRGDQLGQAEVEDLDATLAGDHHVLLQVPVHDARGVGGNQGLGDRARDAQGLPGLQRACREPLAQGHAVHELHRDEAHSLLFADLVDGDDAGVVQGRGGAGLALEAAQALGAGGDLAGQHLDGGLAPELQVAGAIDLPHAPGAQGRQDLVGSEPRSRCQAHRFDSARRMVVPGRGSGQPGGLPGRPRVIRPC